MVTLPHLFSGCPPPRPTDKVIIAHISALHIEAFLVNAILEAKSVLILEIDDNSFILDITATVPIARIEAFLKIQIAHFLGADFTPTDIEIDFDLSSKRSESGTARVILNGDVSVSLAPSIHAYSLFILGLLWLAFYHF
jgi:hypothetical protein